MPKPSTIRNGTFVLFVALTSYAFEERLLAAMGDKLAQMCQNWQDGEGYDCTACSRGQGFPPEWEASGNCDFSGVAPEDLDQTAMAYCQEIMGAFDQTCETEYPHFLAAYYDWSMPTSHPCYSAYTDHRCWFTWTTGSCIAGPTSSWGGNCDRYNWCECEG
jgi:hypothetical protein